MWGSPPPEWIAGAAPARVVGFRRKFVQICSEIRDARKELGAVIGDLNLFAVEFELQRERSATQLNDEPQPQVFEAFGLLISNPDFSRPSL